MIKQSFRVVYLIFGVILSLIIGAYFYFSMIRQESIKPQLKPKESTLVSKHSVYLDQYIQENQRLFNHFIPSAVENELVDSELGIKLKYPDNLIFHKYAEHVGDSLVAIIVPPKIFEISKHLETEYNLPALTMAFESDTDVEKLILKNYSEYKSSAQKIQRSNESFVRLPIVNGFDGSIFFIELLQTNTGVVVFSYLDNDFSRHLYPILDSVTLL